MGGSDKWNTKWRDLGCPLVAFFTIWLLNGIHWNYWWAYLITFGLMFGALTTYEDIIFGYDNMFAHGAGIGLSTLPLLWVGIHWYSILIYTIALSVSMGITRHVLKIDNKIQELIKGALIIIAIPLLTL